MLSGYAWGIVAAGASALLFSGKGIFMKLGFAEGATVSLFMALRMFYAAPFFLVLFFMGIRKAQAQGLPSLSGKDVRNIFALAFCGYWLAGVLDIAGLQYVSAGMERLILYTHPMLVVALGVLLFRRKVGFNLAFALILNSVGLALAFGSELHYGDDKQPLLGGILVLGSAFAYALFLIYSHRILPRIGPDRLFHGGMLACTLMVLVQSMIMIEPEAWFQSSRVHFYSSIVALFGTVFPTMLLGYAMKRIGPERISIVGMIGPVGTLFFSAATLGEPITLWNATGLCLTLAGGAVLMRKK